MSGSSSTSRRSRTATSPPAPASPASAACRCSSCCARSATRTRRSSSRFVRHFDFLAGQWEKERDLVTTREDALLEIYKRARPGEPLSLESARAYFENAFFNPRRYDLTRVGRYKLNRKLGPEIEKISELLGIDLERPADGQGVLSPSEVLAAATYMLHLANGEPGYRLDDQDHFANRRIRSVGELIQNQVRIGLSRMERVVRERMTTQDVEAITPQTLINIRPVVAAIKEFFGTSQLSQFMDQHNPLSGLAHKRRLSALGPGGLSRERAGFEVRDVHTSHYGRMCPIETPEGPNIGLIGHLASYARVNEHGFIETPYRKVDDGRVTDEIVYLAADEEEEYVIAQASATLDDDGHFIGDRVLVRRGPQGAGVRVGATTTSYGTTSEVDFVPPAEVDLMDVSPKQIVSVSTALIPFVEHDDANRALMGANMQKQAVPLLVPEAPYIGTGVEARAAQDAGEVIVAEGAGTVTEVSGDLVTVEYKAGQKDRFGRELGRKVYPLAKFRRSNQNTCINQKVLVAEGETVAAGDVLADGPSTHNGELALGKNLLVAFMPWEGYNYEDAIILSERLVRDDVLTSIHIEEHEVDARDTKLGAEEITRDIPNLSEEILADLDERGIIRIGAEVGPGDILVGKVTPKGETELTPEERLLRAIFGEKARDVRDTSLKVPHGESGKVIDVRVFSRDDSARAAAGRQPAGAGLRRPEAEDLRGRQARRTPRQQGRRLEDPAGRGHAVPRRRHAGRHHLEPARRPEPDERRPGARVAPRLRGPLGLAGRRQTRRRDRGRRRCAAPRRRPGPAPTRRCGSRRRSSTAPTGTKRTRPVATRRSRRSSRTCAPTPPTARTRLIQPDGKATLYNGRTGEAYDNPISVGYMYILKLAHLVDDKIHARSTGPYSMITQQPLGGKAQFGGQRFGEMEVWALEAYGAAYALQELLTIKSDDVLGRVKVYEAIVKGENIPEPGIPESFKVLIKEMQSLCLDVEVLGTSGEEIEMRELDEDVYRTAEELGIDISRPERGSDEEDARRAAERSF